jgi:hypothetical protein
LIDAHAAADEIRGFAQRFQEKATQSIPSQDAQCVISGREGFGPESNESDAAEEPPGHFQKLHGDAPPAHAAGVVQAHAVPAARFQAAATAIERAAEPHAEAARENTGAQEIPEHVRGDVEQARRSMVGALALVGEGKWKADDVSTALERRNRGACAPVAPPDGLYLVRVDYPEV